jgi:homoserine kinase
MVVVVPDFFLPTKAAREVLPEKVDRADAIVNIGSTAMMIAAFIKGSRHFLRNAFDDALHQPYRAELIPGMYDVFKAARKEGALGAFLSGAGPCLMALASGNERSVAEAMQRAFKANNVESTYMILDIDKEGARLIE